MVSSSFALSIASQKSPKQIQKLDYRNTSMRYLVVVVAIFVVFGCEYCFDTASALETFIHDSFFINTGQQLTQAQFNLFYSLYAFPNIIIPLIGGMVIDKYGARVAMVIVATICVAGHTVFGIGGYENSYSIMLLGRIIFGMGGQVLHASQNTLISNWFKASQISMVLGICLSFPKMGSSLNNFITPLLADNITMQHDLNIAVPIFTGVGFMIFSLILAIILFFIDKKSQEKQKIDSIARTFSQKDEVKQSVAKIKFSKFSSQIISPVYEAKSLVANQVPVQEITGNTHEAGQHMNFRDIGKFPLAFWLILVISMLSESLFIPFLDNGNEYYVQIFGIKPTQAGVYLILPYCISSLFVVIFGYLVDKVPKRSYVLIAGCSFYTITYLFMMILESSPSLKSNQIIRWFPSCLLGICIAIFCSIIVPTIPKLISPRLMGTGFGLMEMMQNLALGLFPLIGAALRNTQKAKPDLGFHRQTSFYFVISCLCTAISIILKGVDYTSGQKLDARQKLEKSHTSETSILRGK